MNRQSTIKPPEQDYRLHMTLVLVATLVDIAAIILFGREDSGLGMTFQILGLLTFLPFLALGAGLIYVIIDTRRLASIQQKILFPWAIIALLTLPVYLTYGEIQNNQVRYYYDLPDNNTMTVWQEYIIFEKYDSFFRPRSNYIKLPRGADDWELTIDSMGRSAVYVYEKARKIKSASPRYPLVATYEGSPGQYWFYADFPADQWMANYYYRYDHDGFFSAANMDYTLVINDSAYHLNGFYPGRAYAYYKQTEPFPEPMDSLLISFQKRLKHYQSQGYYTKDGEYKCHFWPDSTQYSAFHKTNNDTNP